MEPDAIIASKCITAGYFPMGAILLSGPLADKIMDVSRTIEEFPHGFTAGAHPVGCAVALKAIDLIQNGGLLDNVRQVAPHFNAHLAHLAGHPNIGEARGIGLMGALELVADKASKSPLPANLQVSERLANEALRNGLIVRPLGASIVIAPPFISTAEDIDEIFQLLKCSLDRVLATV
jgi:adenosylmethionine-8-amino-7-oxononanoate aminotransferase